MGLPCIASPFNLSSAWLPQSFAWGSMIIMPFSTPNNCELFSHHPQPASRESKVWSCWRRGTHAFQEGFRVIWVPGIQISALLKKSHWNSVIRLFTIEAEASGIHWMELIFWSRVVLMSGSDGLLSTKASFGSVVAAVPTIRNRSTLWSGLRAPGNRLMSASFLASSPFVNIGSSLWTSAWLDLHEVGSKFSLVSSQVVELLTLFGFALSTTLSLCTQIPEVRFLLSGELTPKFVSDGLPHKDLHHSSTAVEEGIRPMHSHAILWSSPRLTASLQGRSATR